MEIIYYVKVKKIKIKIIPHRLNDEHFNPMYIFLVKGTEVLNYRKEKLGRLV